MTFPKRYYESAEGVYEDENGDLVSFDDYEDLHGEYIALRRRFAKVMEDIHEVWLEGSI